MKIPKGDILNFLNSNSFIKNESNSIRRSNIKNIVENLEIIAFNGRYEEIYNHFIVGIYIDKNYFLEKIKKLGLLRHSSYYEFRNPIPAITENLIKHKVILNLTDAEITYFQSLSNLNKIYLIARNINADITQTVRNLKPRKTISIGILKLPVSKLAALLTFNEYNFSISKDRFSEYDSIDKIEDLSRESISEAISLLVSRYDEIHGLSTFDLASPDIDYVFSSNLKSLIVKTCQLKRIEEINLLVEHYNYTCHLNNGKIIVSHNDENILKSKSLSDIIYSGQRNASDISFQERYEDAVSLEDYCKEVLGIIPDLFKLEEEPISRYTLKIIEPLIVKTSEIDNLFKEEIRIIADTNKELFLFEGNFDKFYIRENFTLKDFMICNRLIVMIYSLFTKKLLERFDSNKDEVLRSLIVCMKEEDFKDLLFWALPDKNKINLFIEIFSWFANSGEYLDLQYTPLIKVKDSVIISPTIFTFSRLIRNIIQSEAKKNNNLKNDKNNYEEPISNFLRIALEKCGFQVFTGVSIKYKTSTQNQSDIDVLAIKDGNIFIFECKDISHPTDIFELRQTYDQMLKAQKQLIYIRTALSDEQYIKEIKKRVEFNGEVKTINFGIVLSNRKFWGYHIGDFPVRNIHELIAFLERGIWTFGIPDKGKIDFKLWKEDIFSNTDLIDFLSKENSPHYIQLQSMLKKTVDLANNLTQNYYVLVLEEMLLKMRDKYRIDKNTEGVNKQIETDF
jgi:hypothetical protein